MNKLIVQHREITAQIKSLQSELSSIENSPEYAEELKFAEKLENLMKEHGKKPKDIVQMLDPDAAISKSSERGPKTGTPRKRLTYKNPHTNEVIHTASGNNRVLKEWKIKHPNEDIKNWIVKGD